MMQKTYLSRAMTRAMAFDHPIGDPTGGPAYGEKNDPISAIISIGTMFTASAGFTAFASMTLLQGMAFAGAAISLVGNVTGNKSLSKIGAVVGLVGGIGSLAEGAGWIDKTSSLGDTFGSAAPAATGGTEALVGTQSVTPVANGVVANPVAAEGLGGLEAAGTGTPPPVDLSAGPAAVAPSAAAPTTELAGGAPNLAAESVVAPAAAPAAAPAPAVAQPAAAGFDATASEGSLAKIAPPADQSYMEQFSAFAQKNPMAAYGLINVGAQAVGGIADSLSGKTDAEIDAMKAQTGYADAKALEIQAALDKEKTRRANLNAGYSQVNTSMGVNPNASVAPAWQPQQPIPQPGLIAGARTA